MLFSILPLFWWVFNSSYTAMAEPRDGQQRQAPPFEPPATAHLPVRNSGNGIWIDAQQRQAPLFEPPDLSCRLPAAFARRRFGFTSNIRSRPVGGIF